eukprot:3382805-Rhodomonas_salina.1
MHATAPAEDPEQVFEAKVFAQRHIEDLDSRRDEGPGGLEGGVLLVVTVREDGMAHVRQVDIDHELALRGIGGVLEALVPAKLAIPGEGELASHERGGGWPALHGQASEAEPQGDGVDREMTPVVRTELLPIEHGGRGREYW